MAGRAIGVLALQGAFAKHEEMLQKLGVPTLQVRYAHQLAECYGLILPGGESTTLTYQIKERNLLAPLKAFAQDYPLFGTCAGMIVMAKEGILSLLDIAVARNAYGRQSDSFSTSLHLTFSETPVHVLFIRAPRISALLSDKVQILAEHEGSPVLIRQGLHLAAAFHAELTNDAEIHQYYVHYAKQNCLLHSSR